MNSTALEKFSGFPPLKDPDSGENLIYENDTVVSKSSRYPVINSIPRILPHIDENYSDAFGEQWNRWRLTQLDSHTGLPITRERLLRCLGSDLATRMSKLDSPIDVLEAGCGAGRFTEILLDMPAVRLTSLDLSSAVDANQLNFPQNSRHRVVQADVCRPPFAPGSFDVVVCLGVIQHTPDPEETIRALYSLVKPGGWLVIDHYLNTWKRWSRLSANAIRPIIKRLPPARRMRAIEALTAFFLPLHRALRHSKWGSMVLLRISPILSFYHMFPQLSDELQREWAILDTHDGLTDWYKHLRTPSQIRTTLELLGGSEIVCGQGGNGVEARCRRT